MAHPLLPRAAAVANSVALGGSAPHLLLVSGSNMSGKSTLLRTVGLNAVLAQAGAPVRAARLTMSSLAIGATLRIQDSLQAGRSRFYAEITRLGEIVRLTASDANREPGRASCFSSTNCSPEPTRTIGFRARPASCPASSSAARSGSRQRTIWR